jgi:hypothetical protein
MTSRSSHLTVIRPDRIDRYAIDGDKRLLGWTIDAELLRGAYMVTDPDLMLDDAMCFEAAETPKPKEVRK